MKISSSQILSAIIICDLKLKVLEINQAAENILLYHMNDYQKYGLKLLSEEFFNQLKKEIKKKSPSFEEIYYTKDRLGEHKFIKIITNLKTEDQLILINFINVTKIQDEEIQFFKNQRIDNLQNITKYISLEYNNHLAAILGFVSFIKNLVNPSSEILNYLNVIENSALKASSLTNQLLSFSGTDFFKQTYINLNKNILSNVELFENTFSSKIKFELNLSLKDSVIYWDENQISQVVINTILNSKDAIEKKEEPGIIRIITEADHRYIKYIIEDNGIGINKKNIKQIFKPYFTTKNIKTNSGLGLSAVDGIIKNIGGKILVDHVAGFTRFTICFPNKEININKYDGQDNVSNGETILVIDDKEAIRNLVYILLTEKKFKPVTVKDNIEAFEVLETKKVDLILLDIKLQDMSGEDLFYQIKKKYPKIPIVLLTGSTDKKIISDLVKREGAGIIVKPFKNYQFYNEIFKKLR